MQIELTGENESVITHTTAEESAVIKEALAHFFNSRPEKFMSDEEKAKRKRDKKIALALHSQFPEPVIKYTH